MKNIWNRCKSVIDPNSARNIIFCLAPVHTWPFIHPRPSVYTTSSLSVDCWGWKTSALGVLVLVCSIQDLFQFGYSLGNSAVKTPCNCWNLYGYIEGRFCLSQIKKFSNYPTQFPTFIQLFYFYGIFLDIKQGYKLISQLAPYKNHSNTFNFFF